jgi:stearoyl-CoA desaturase (Delta-9 desaturase)
LSRPAATAVSGETHEHEDDTIYPNAIPFVLVHLACFAAIWTGVTLEAVVICVALYWIRMIGVTGGYHRYFSHRSYKTSRVGQFLIACLAQSSAQQGAIWWAAVHRAHHRHSDTELDPHSPRHYGFFHSHVGWIFHDKKDRPSYDTVSDLTRYPELVWLDKHQYVVPAILGTAVWLFAGWSGLIVGFVWSTVLCWHGTFTINSLAHVHGTQRYLTGDDSRNNWWLAIITCGEGWHNNHHAYQSSTRQGFRWYQIDMTYYVLKVASWTGLVWDLREPPAEVVSNEHRLGRNVVEKVALQVAETFPTERLASQLRDAWEHHPTWPEIQARMAAARAEAAARMATIHLPELPTADELRRRARETFRVPEVSLDEVAERARQHLIHAVSVRILGKPDALSA